MENKSKKYLINQNEQIYTLTTQIYEDKLRFACIEKKAIEQLVYIAEFSIEELKSISPIFSSLTSITEAQDIFHIILISGKLSLDNYINHLNLDFTKVNDNQIEESFIIKLNLYENDITIQQPIQSNSINILNLETNSTNDNQNKENYFQVHLRDSNPEDTLPNIGSNEIIYDSKIKE